MMLYVNNILCPAHKINHLSPKNGVKPAHISTSGPDRLTREEYPMDVFQDKTCLVTGNLKHFPVNPFIVTPAQFSKSCRDKAAGLSQSLL